MVVAVAEHSLSDGLLSCLDVRTLTHFTCDLIYFMMCAVSPTILPHEHSFMFSACDALR